VFAGLFQFSHIIAFGQSCSISSSPPTERRGWETGGGGEFGVYCYDVYEASYYYGCVEGDPNCHESVDYKYVGTECEYAN
jgi:hypothetical protein